MRYGVIDVGSNSVRLMISNGVCSISKTVITTRLSEGMGEDKIFTDTAIERTVNAVYFFIEQAKKEKVDEIFVFATAAVRQANNRSKFVSEIKEKCGVDVDVVSGEEEALLGYTGALLGRDGGVIDVGGASSEVIAVSGGERLFSKSVNVGAVKAKDVCGQDRKTAEKFIAEMIDTFGEIPKVEYCAIGGTATTVGAILQEFEVYDAEKNDGYIVDKETLSQLTDKLFSMSVEERKKLKGLQPERAEVIACGALILLRIIDKIGVDHFTISEKDNLEGYIIRKRG